MKSTAILRDEHKTIQLFLSAAELEIASIRKTGRLDRLELQCILDFLTNYVGWAHHTKEEKYLFVKIEERCGGDMSIPVAVMAHEHAEGRSMIRTIQEAMTVDGKSEAAAAAIADSLDDFIYFMLNHINKENNVIFPLADSLLTPLDQLVLAEKFAEVDMEVLEEGDKLKYHLLAKKYSNNLTMHNLRH
jgi:hemerythrin-like domain-containing protein